MTAKEFLNNKVMEMGYDDFQHYLDCYEYVTEQTKQIEKWVKELISIKCKEKVELVIQRIKNTHYNATTRPYLDEIFSIIENDTPEPER